MRTKKDFNEKIIKVFLFDFLVLWSVIICLSEEGLCIISVGDTHAI